MRRKTWLTAALAIAVALAFVGCDNPTSSDDDDGVKAYVGVYGIAAGVVYDSVTGLPIADADVTIPGYPAVKTDASGSYVIKDIIPGDYTVTVRKTDFTAFSTSIKVDAARYREDDPLWEWHNLNQQINNFEQWILTNGPVSFPEYDGMDFDTTASGTWTYDAGGGVYVNGDGSATVTIDGTAEFPTFEVVYNKLDDYVYNYGIKVNLVKLTPLTGGFTGKIDVVFEVNDQTLILNGTTTAKEGIEIYFVDMGTHDITDDIIDDIPTPVTVSRKYGPFTTKTGGVFVADKLPANTPFIMQINPFSQTKGSGATAVEYYFVPEFADNGNIFRAGKWLTALEESNGLFITSTGNKQIPGETETDPVTSEGYTDLGQFYIFTVGNVAYVTESNVPNAGAPFQITGTTPDTITLTFSKPIWTGNFTASLTLNANAKVEPGVTTQALQAQWTDNTSVVLSAGEWLEGYSRISFPYSNDVALPIGTLDLTGVAADGSPIYKIDEGYDIYTESALALIGIEYLSVAAAPERAVSDIGGAIKLTFNKALASNSPNTKFTLGGVELSYKFEPNEPNSVYVYTDVEFTSDQTLDYIVTAAADAGDILPGTLTEIQVTLAKLVLKSTNLYTDRFGFGYPADAATGHFPVDGSITFTFVDIPAGAAASAVLAEDGGDPVYAAAEVNYGTKTVTITTAQLAPDTTYTLDLRIVKSATEPYTLYTVPDSNPWLDIDDSGAVNLIKFKTAASELILTGSNLYTDRNNIAHTKEVANGWFPVDNVLTFTFAATPAIPENAVASAVLQTSGGAPVYTDVALNVEAKTVTVTPAQLLPNTEYHLSLQIIKSLADPVVYYDSSVALSTSPVYINSNLIKFKTAPTELILTGTNLYTDQNGVQRTPAAGGIFPVGGPLQFTFNALPANPVIVAELKEGSTVIPVTPAYDGATVSIPALLKRDTTYTLALEIRNSAQRVFYTNPTTSGGSEVSGLLYINGSTIEFRTAALRPLAGGLISTNLYVDPETHIDPGAGNGINATAFATYFNFAVDSNIELTFGEAIPAEARLDIQLKDASYNTIGIATPVVADSVITIDPVDNLLPGKAYYLSVRVVDVANVPYWVVPALTDTTVAYTNNQFVTPQGDTKQYIGFNTQKEEVTLLSTNLYLDGLVGNHAERYFPLNGAIELVFDNIPSGTRISKAQLANSANAASGISVYADFDPLAPNKVIITPSANAKLSAVGTGTYYLQLTLDKTPGADPIWSVTGGTSSGVAQGPVWVVENSSVHEIQFNVVSTLSVKSTSTVTNLTNFASNTPTGSFAATNDIIVEFDRPVTLAKAELWYTRTGNYYDRTVASGELSLDRTILTIKPEHLLAPNATFAVRLDVASDDGQRMVFDSTNIGVSDWVNSYDRDLWITTAADVHLVGIPSSKAVITSGNLVLPAITNISDTAADLTFTAGLTSFDQLYTIYATRFGIWSTTAVASNISVLQNTTAPTTTPISASIPPGTSFVHYNAEHILYKIRGVNNAGYVTEAVTPEIVFTP